ncbi:unnamed protein product [Staurois parvus]|uniref:Uncharacterized protein n=1 Tax=Staurois parvus TaxID=386267 RepID=A0ABN9F7L2_9NEOB|nr:unnamed protein product [Staurois parvus]
MQTASKNICERLCNKSICEISLLLNILSQLLFWYTKCKQLGTTAAQPRSDRMGSAHAEMHSAQNSPTVCRANN